MILFPTSVTATAEEVRGWMLTNPFSLAFLGGSAPPPTPTSTFIMRMRARFHKLKMKPR